MVAESEATLVDFGAWVGAILESHQAEIKSRGLILRLEVEPDFVISPSEPLAFAVRLLFVLILMTIPDGCEIYLGGSRSLAPVSRLGAGRFSARWQVMGSSGVRRGTTATRIHPRPGDARLHARSAHASKVHSAFAATDWSFTLESLSPGGELLARAERQ